MKQTLTVGIRSRQSRAVRIAHHHSTLVVVDPNVPQASRLVEGVQPDVGIALLKPNEDGVQQITRILQTHPQIAHLHVISHGTPGSLQLGNTQLNLQTLEQYAWELQSWFAALPASLLLYGCQIASGAGNEFLTRLHQLTGADIAASTSLTGAASQGGNWNLEVQIGNPQVQLALTPETLASYPGVLAGDLSFVEVEKDGVNGVDGLAGAFGVAVSPDGKFVYVTGNNDNAITVFSRNAITGALTLVNVQQDGVGGVDGLNRPLEVTISPDGLHIYVAGRSDNGIAVFSRNDTTGLLTFVEVLKDGIGGVDGLAGADSVTLSPDGKFVYATGETDSAIAVFARNELTGALTFVEVLKDNVNGVDGLAFPWQVKVSPDGQHVYATGRADNAIAVFTRDATTGRLTFQEIQKDGINSVDGLAGANSLSFSADGKFVYATGRTDSAIAVFSRDASTGALTFVEVQRDGVNGVDGLAGASGVAVSLNGDYLYVTGRSDNAIAIFARNATSGRLAYVGLKRDGVGGVDGLNGAQNLEITPDGQHLYAAGAFDNAIAAFSLSATPTSQNSSITTGINTAYRFVDGDFPFIDSDVGDSLQTVRIAALATAGSLFLDANSNSSLDAGEAVILNQEIAAANLGNLIFQPDLNDVGSTYATFGFQVSDGKWYSNQSYTMTVDVIPPSIPPIITEGNTVSVTMSEDSIPTAFALTLNATDADNDPLSWRIKTAATHGTAAASGRGNAKTISYVPTANYNGLDSFEVEVSDGNGGTDTITVNVTVTPQNDAPTAQNRTVLTAEETAYSFKAADFAFADVDGDSLQIVRISGLPSAGSLFLDGDLNSTQDAGEAVILNQDIALANLSQLKFRPAAGGNGYPYATFNFQVSDGQLFSPSYMMAVNVDSVPFPPVITQGDAVTVNLDEDSSPIAFALTLNATDADNDPLTWSILNPALQGTASLAPTGNDTVVNYTPNVDYNGLDSFVVMVSDSNGTTDAITINLNIAAQNDAPTSQNGSITTAQGGDYAFKSADFSFSDVDPGDQLQAVKITALETAGELLLNGNTVSLNDEIAVASLGNLVFKPAAGANGAPYATFGFRVGDGQAFSSQVYSMTVNVTATGGQPGGNPSGGNLPSGNPSGGNPSGGNSSGGNSSGGTGDSGGASPTVPTGSSPSGSTPNQMPQIIPGTPLFAVASDFTPIDFTPGRKGVRRKGTDRSEILRGTPFSDVILGSGGNDRILPGWLKKHFGNDRVLGGDGNDWIVGGKNNDWLQGNAGNDKLFGGDGRDAISGDAGNDQLVGGRYSDRLTGGTGKDVITGGGSRDLFVYSSLQEGGDQITDFSTEDLLDLRQIFQQSAFKAATPLAQYQQFVKLAEVNGGVAVQIDADGNQKGTNFATLVLLKGTSLSEISTQNFMMA